VPRLRGSTGVRFGHSISPPFPELVAAVRPLLEARKAIEQQVSELDRKRPDDPRSRYFVRSIQILTSKAPEWCCNRIGSEFWLRKKAVRIMDDYGMSALEV